MRPASPRRAAGRVERNRDARQSGREMAARDTHDAHQHQSSIAVGSPSATRPVHYTVVVRLPFARGEFQDPPQIDWDVGKDKKLWKLISRGPVKPRTRSPSSTSTSTTATTTSTTTAAINNNPATVPSETDDTGAEDNRATAGRRGDGGGIDWEATAAEFGVDTGFLVRQAAWLYERHLRQVKAQIMGVSRGKTAVSGAVKKGQSGKGTFGLP